jgi:serine/threonine protein kinase
MLAFRFTLGERSAVWNGAEVYPAFGDVGIGPVVVKLVRPAVAGREGGALALRLADQAENLRAVVHPGIVRLVADGWDDPLGARFLVLEAVAGETLEARRARPRKLDVGLALELTDALCEVLGLLHEHSLVHLDLAPNNVVLAAPGAPFPLKLQDVGAYRTGEAPALPSVALGALPYVAPERLRGEACDARSDVHAVGALLYRMLGGHPPFRGTTVEELLESRKRGVPPLFAVGASPAAEADRAARKCVADDPAQRFGGPAELRDALAGLRAKLPGLRQPAG